MSAILRIPEKTGKDLLLVTKLSKSDVKVETSDKITLEVGSDSIDVPVTIAKYLVAENRPELLGKDKLEQAQVEEWLAFSSASIRNASKKEVISNIEKKLNEHLSNNTFIVGNHLTLADVLIFGLLQSYTKNLKVASCPNVLRWFDLIQNIVIKSNNLTDVFPILEINLDDVPEPVAPVVVKKGDKKGEKADDKNAKADNKKEAKADNKKDAKADNKKDAKADNKKEVKGDNKKEANTAENKPKKEKKKAEKKPAAAPVESDQPVVSRLDIRVGLIKSCKKHEGADSLYVEEIDVGEEEPRTIVSGLVRWYPVEEMENRYVLVLANLKPASMRGVKSFGMVLCASAPDGSKVELLGPVDTSKVKPGDRVYIEGQEGEAEKTLNPKKKYWETVQPELKTDDNLIAHYGDKPLLIKTASGEAIKCKVATVKNGGIK